MRQELPGGWEPSRQLAFVGLISYLGYHGATQEDYEANAFSDH